MASAMVKASKNGSMEAVTKGNGRTGRLTVAVSYTTLMEISMRETGMMTKLMEMVLTLMRTERSM